MYRREVLVGVLLATLVMLAIAEVAVDPTEGVGSEEPEVAAADDMIDEDNVVLAGPATRTIVTGMHGFVGS